MKTFRLFAFSFAETGDGGSITWEVDHFIVD